jgi:hypothetical protein
MHQQLCYQSLFITELELQTSKFPNSFVLQFSRQILILKVAETLMISLDNKRVSM